MLWMTGCAMSCRLHVPDLGANLLIFSRKSTSFCLLWPLFYFLPGSLSKSKKRKCFRQYILDDTWLHDSSYDPIVLYRDTYLILF